MFGYVRPFKGEMLVKEYDAYKGVYCQLCRALGKYYGFPMRLTLSYDCTLYAMLALNQRDADVKAEKKRCCCNPMKKCTYVCPANEDVFAEEAFHKAAALSIIMTVHKLRDTAADEDGLKAFGARVLRLFTRRAMKKASNDYPFMADAVRKMMDDQADAEHAKEISIDRCSAPTAEMLPSSARLHAVRSSAAFTATAARTLPAGQLAAAPSTRTEALASVAAAEIIL